MKPAPKKAIPMQLHVWDITDPSPAAPVIFWDQASIDQQHEYLQELNARSEDDIEPGGGRFAMWGGVLVDLRRFLLAGPPFDEHWDLIWTMSKARFHGVVVRFLDENQERSGRWTPAAFVQFATFHWPNIASR